MRIHTIGGYNEVGKNMTAVEVGNDVLILDCGLFLPAIVDVQEKEKIPTEKWMRSIGALPEDLYMDRRGLRKKVRAMLISHAHLDHVGGVPYLAQRYNAKVVGTPFTMEVLKVLMQDNGQSIPNKIIPVALNRSFNVRGENCDYKVEFVNITHSTIEASVIAIHTKEGIVIYANDYKLDNTPTFGEPPNYKRLKELSNAGVKLLIIDSMRAPEEEKVPSERIAKYLLEEVLFGTENRKSAIIISTFSSHIARLKTISEFGRKLNRQVIFLGRSLNKYTTAARNVGKGQFMKNVRIFSYRKQVESILKKVERNREKYLVVCTGHQGEPGSVLDRIARGELHFKLQKEDHVIFSSKTIPTPINEETKAQLVRRLKKYNVRIFENIHASGHGGREDLRDFIKLVKPKHIIPTHGDFKMTSAGANLAEELGYKLNKTVHLMQNEKFVDIK